MADQTTVKIDGLERLEARLRAMQDQNKVKRVVVEALKAGAQVERAAIIEAAPIRPALPAGTALPPGALANDVEIHQTHAANGDIAVSVGFGKLTRRVAKWVEYGHQMITGGRRSVVKGRVSGNGKLTKVTGTTDAQVPGHPFFRPAVERVREETAKAIFTALENKLPGMEK